MMMHTTRDPAFVHTDVSLSDQHSHPFPSLFPPPLTPISHPLFFLPQHIHTHIYVDPHERVHTNAVLHPGHKVVERDVR